MLLLCLSDAHRSPLPLTPLPHATKMAQMIFRDQNYVSRAIHFVLVCIHIMSIHSVYLVADLEGSDNGDPTNGIIVLSVGHGLVTVLDTLKNVSRASE